MTTENSSCSVCCENFNRSTHKKTVCNYCQYNVCIECSARYLLQSSTDPHCMNCRHAWNRENLETNFTKKFVTGDYKKHRENVIFERQLSMMPETQPYVELEREAIKYREEIVQINKQTAKVKSELRSHYLSYHSSVNDQNAYINYEMKCAELSKKIESSKIDVLHKTRIVGYLSGTGRNQTLERKQFVRACPAQNCKGFLSTQWKCGICDAKVCKDCHEIKPENEEEHVCDQNDLETARLLDKDSKPCPKCASMIFKIEGCDQMYCTQCHTAFSWRTGHIETGTIHNPHYYEFQRRQNGGIAPRVPGDIPCGGIPDVYNFHQHLITIATHNAPILSKLQQIHRMNGHIQYIELPRYAPNDHLNEHRDLRIKYMINSLSEKNFKATLQQREKANDKKREICMVLQTYQAITIDNMNAVMTSTTITELLEIEKRMEELREYINNCMKAIAKRYANVAPIINARYQFSSTGIEIADQKRQAAARAAALVTA